MLTFPEAQPPPAKTFHTLLLLPSANRASAKASHTFRPENLFHCEGVFTFLRKMTYPVQAGTYRYDPNATNFYQNARGFGASAAFTRAPSTITSTNPGGDQYLPKFYGRGPAKNWAEVVGSGTPPKGYAFGDHLPVSWQGSNFKGYTQGPGYW